MADDWEAEDWDAKEDFKPVLPGANAVKPADAEASKFADEDADLVDEKTHVVPASQPKKKEEKKYMKATGPVDMPLDDPAAEKLRRQRLEEQSDMAAAKDLFGEEHQVNLDLYLPKTVKEFEDFAAALAGKYITSYKDSKHYKVFLKALFKNAVAPLTSVETKDVETSLAGLRVEKNKAEVAEAAAKKGVKKSLNLGKGSGSAGLDDYIYDDAGAGDDFDFM